MLSLVHLLLIISGHMTVYGGMISTSGGNHGNDTSESMVTIDSEAKSRTLVITNLMTSQHPGIHHTTQSLTDTGSLVSETSEMTTLHPDDVTSANPHSTTQTMNECIIACHNGRCVLNEGVSRCNCSIYFYGNTCQLVDLKMAAFTYTSSSITFNWKVAVNLNNYISTHYVMPDDQVDSPNQEDITFDVLDPSKSQTTTSVEVTGLVPGVSNVVCIILMEDKNLIEASVIQSHINITVERYCVQVLTKSDGMSMLAVSGVCLGLVLSALTFAFMTIKCKYLSFVLLPAISAT